MADEAPIELRPPADLATVRFRTIHGYRRAYRMAGHGPMLLLLHGIGDSSASWAPVMAELARDHTVIVPDLLGHGDSDKPRADYSVAAFANGMRDLLEVLGVDRATVVGHSLGGGVAAQFAYQYPERCERLVLVATGGVAREVTPVLRFAAAPLSELALLPLRLLPAAVTGRLMGGVLRLLGNDVERDDSELVRVIERLSDDSSRRAFIRTLRAVVDWRGQMITLRDRCYLADSVPTLVVWGECDGVIPSDHAFLLGAALPRSRVEIFPGAGHSPHRTEPERFVALLRDFVAATEPAIHQPGQLRERLRQGRPAALLDDAAVLAAARARARGGGADPGPANLDAALDPSSPLAPPVAITGA